jgi:hypothetical protein
LGFVTLIFLFLQVLQAASTGRRLGVNLVEGCVDKGGPVEELGTDTAGSRRRNSGWDGSNAGSDMENQIINYLRFARVEVTEF